MSNVVYILIGGSIVLGLVSAVIAFAATCLSSAAKAVTRKDRP